MDDQFGKGQLVRAKSEWCRVRMESGQDRVRIPKTGRVRSAASFYSLQTSSHLLAKMFVGNKSGGPFEVGEQFGKRSWFEPSREGAGQNGVGSG